MAALDTTIAVVTPENIAFDYQLAGPFRRLPAYLIDVVARTMLLALIVLVMWLIGGLISFVNLSSYLLAASFLLYFVLTNFYGTLMESYFNGKTIGKWACGIRVVGVDGGPIDVGRALLRNLIRVADLAPYAVLNQVSEDVPPVFFLPMGIFGVVTMICTRRMQRLGDLAAGTMVIVDERHWELPITRIEDPRVAALASYLPQDYRISRSMARTLAVYAERRHYLTPMRRREIARKLTTHLIDRFEFRRDIDPDLLMQSLYYRNFLWEPSADPADLGALAGFSPLAKDVHRADAVDPPDDKDTRPETQNELAADVSGETLRDAPSESPGENTVRAESTS